VLVANLGRIQGGLPILPDAVPDDGQFDIAVLKTRTLGDWVGVATRILVRSHTPGPDVDTFRAHTVDETPASLRSIWQKSKLVAPVPGTPSA
jgi:diacylglycerol kinase family enzyme